MVVYIGSVTALAQDAKAAGLGRRRLPAELAAVSGPHDPRGKLLRRFRKADAKVERVRRNLGSLSEDDKASLIRTRGTP